MLKRLGASLMLLALFGCAGKEKVVKLSPPPPVSCCDRVLDEMKRLERNRLLMEQMLAEVRAATGETRRQASRCEFSAVRAERAAARAELSAKRAERIFEKTLRK